PLGSTLFPYTTLFRSRPGPLTRRWGLDISQIVSGRRQGAWRAQVATVKHDARAPVQLQSPSSRMGAESRRFFECFAPPQRIISRSEEHTSELQSLAYL